MSVEDISEHAVANLGCTDIELVHPVYVGDTIWADSLIKDARVSRSRPNAGIVTVATRGLNQDGVTFMRFTRSEMVLNRQAHSDRNPGFARTPRWASRQGSGKDTGIV